MRSLEEVHIEVIEILSREGLIKGIDFYLENKHLYKTLEEENQVVYLSELYDAICNDERMVGRPCLFTEETHLLSSCSTLEEAIESMKRDERTPLDFETFNYVVGVLRDHANFIEELDSR